MEYEIYERIERFSIAQEPKITEATFEVTMEEFVQLHEEIREIEKMSIEQQKKRVEVLYGKEYIKSINRLTVNVKVKK